MLISMIGHTFAAKPFAGTGLIRTIAAVFIRLGFAFHPGNPYEDEREPAKIGEILNLIDQQMTEANAASPEIFDRS